MTTTDKSESRTGEPPTHQLRALIVDDPIEVWNEVGFDGDEVIVIGSTTIVPTAASEDRAGGHRRGIVGAAIDGVGRLDGLDVGTWMPTAENDIPAAGHPNGVSAIDHVVVMTPDSDRTTQAFEAQGIDLRRVRRIPLDDGDRRQSFFWLGDVICEVVGPDTAADNAADRPAQWWGLALTVADIDATAAALGDVVTPVKDAVQPGRRVCTLRRDAGLGVPLLFISPHVSPP